MDYTPFDTNSQPLCFERKSIVNQKYYNLENPQDQNKLHNLNNYFLANEDISSSDNNYNNDFFHIKEFQGDNVSDCKAEASKHLANFFLVNNLHFNKDETSPTYNCLVPKYNIKYYEEPNQEKESVFSLIISPINLFIENFLIKSNKIDEENISNKNELEESLHKCVKYKPDTNNNLNYFGKGNNFVLYKNKINEETISVTNETLQIYDVSYDNYFIENNYIFDRCKKNRTTRNNQIIRQSTTGNYFDKTFHKQDCRYCWKPLSKYKQYIKNTESFFEEIQNTIGIINNDVTNVIDAYKKYLNNIELIENKLIQQKDKLNKIKKNNNGNNANLFDSKYLKKIKLMEIITLSIIAILAIIIAVKKK